MCNLEKQVYSGVALDASALAAGTLAKQAFNMIPLVPLLGMHTYIALLLLNVVECCWI